MAARQQRVEKIECNHSGDISCVKPLHKQVKRFIAQADQLCAKRNQRFTALRKQVLSLVSGGYDSCVASYDSIRRGMETHYCFFNLGGRAHEGEPCLFVARKQFGADADDRFCGIEELISDARVPRRGGSGHTDAVDVVFVEDRSVLAERFDGAGDRIWGELPAGPDATAESGDGVHACQRFGVGSRAATDQQPGRVGAAIDRGEDGIRHGSTLQHAPVVEEICARRTATRRLPDRAEIRSHPHGPRPRQSVSRSDGGHRSADAGTPRS